MLTMNEEVQTTVENESPVEVNESKVRIERLELKIADVPKYFDRYDAVCSLDIVAYVRKFDRIPDYNVFVVLDADCAPFDKEFLSGHKIYWSGVTGNEGDINSIAGLADNLQIPVYAEQLKPDREDLGLRDIWEEFGMRYDLDRYILLLCGEADDPIISEAWRYAVESGASDIRCDVPPAVADARKIRENAIDITPELERISKLRNRNEFNRKTLFEIVDKIDAQIKDMQLRGISPVIQCSGETEEAGVLPLYFTMKHFLAPLYNEKHLDDYMKRSFNYDYNKLSLYERFQWVRNLPEEFGLLNPDANFHCFCTLCDEQLYVTLEPDKEETALATQYGIHMGKKTAKRIYPKPLYMAYFDMASNNFMLVQPERVIQVVDNEESVDDTTWEIYMQLYRHVKMFDYLNYADVMEFADFRSLFPQSQNPFGALYTPTSGQSQIANQNDLSLEDIKADFMLKNIFAQLAETVRKEYDEAIYPTVKNSLLYPVGDKKFMILYCPGSLGVTCRLDSKYFDRDIHILGEEVFNRFIDRRTLLAVIAKGLQRGERNFESSNKRFAEIITVDQSNLLPALDLDIMLITCVLKPNNNGLSYFDRMLRTTKNVIPIVTDKDNALYTEPVIFNHFNYLDLLRADTSQGPISTITCFGTLEDTINAKPVLQTTLESYRGCKLL